jgi:uncharacterized membrane protein (DUF373 family)
MAEGSSRARLERRHRPLRLIDRVEVLIHYCVAMVLLAIAAVVLVRTVEHLVTGRHEFTAQVINGINDVLFVVIVMELLRTVVSHLETDDFQVKSFLIIGIISAVRHIVSVGARLTLTGPGNETLFRHAQIELGVSAAVVLSLAIGLLLVSRSEPTPV